jgi:hypothetical protein
MKRFLTLMVMLIFSTSCGPSEEEVQNRINEAIESATNTSTTTTTLPEKECNEYLFTVLNIFAIIEDELKSLPSDSEAASYELHTEYYAKKSAKLKSQESRISQIRSRTATELDILIELEEYRSLSFSYASKSLFNLLNFVPIGGPDFKEMMNFSNEANKTGNQLLIRINNYKCEA